jgi:hypothetical protein
MDIDEAISKAGEAEGIPPDPPGGIPRQWLPGWIRWPIRVLLIPWLLLDLWAQKVALWVIKPPFRQVGSCLKRGNCCHYILLPEPEGILGKLNYVLNMQINGFYPRYPEAHEYDGERVIVMGCRYLQKDGKCKHYRLRPAVCRKWPVIEHFGRPRVLKGCGFKPIPRQPSKSSLNVLK